MKILSSKALLHLILAISFSVGVIGQPVTSLIKVIVSPDHKNWTYQLNQEAKFSVQVLKYGNPVENAVVDYETGPEMLPDIKKEGVVLKNGKIEFSGSRYWVER